MLYFILFSCSNSSLNKSFDESPQASGDYADTGSSSEDEALDSNDAVWWKIHANLVVEEFGFSGDSFIEFWIYDTDMTQICVVHNRVELLQEVSPPFDEGHLWWDIQLRQFNESEPNDTGVASDTGEYDNWNCENQSLLVPQRFYIGIGEMHPEIVAAWNDIDWGDSASSSVEPNNIASYLSFQEQGDVYVFGTAISTPVQEENSIWSSFQGKIEIFSAYPFSF